MRHLNSFRRFPGEACVWLGGLLALACLDPNDNGASLCLFHLLGIDACPGCGLGHSISFFLRGEWSSALAAHPLGPAAVLILLGRVLRLLYDFFRVPRFSHNS